MENNAIKDLIEKNAAYRNIVERVSVRRFADRDVAPELQEAICYAAFCAPSGVNKQPWELFVIDDRQTLARLADALPYAKMTAEAPMAIVTCGNPDRFLEGVDDQLWIQDLSALSENILLAAHALGLGGVWTCLYPHDERIEPVKEILGLKEDMVPFNLIPIGYPATAHAPMDKWHPERVHRL